MIDITDIPTAVTAPAPQKAARKSPPGIGGLINFALMAWMIWDLRKRSDAELNGKRKLWFLAAFAPPIGPIVYIVYLRRRKAQKAEIALESAAQA
jgi:hypothetical protein